MNAFRVTGTFRMGDEWQRFTKEVAADSEARARDLVLSDLGSKHGLPRRLVRIKAVSPVPREEITDPVVRHRLGGAK